MGGRPLDLAGIWPFTAVANVVRVARHPDGEVDGELWIDVVPPRCVASMVGLHVRAVAADGERSLVLVDVPAEHLKPQFGHNTAKSTPISTKY